MSKRILFITLTMFWGLRRPLHSACLMRGSCETLKRCLKVWCNIICLYTRSLECWQECIFELLRVARPVSWQPKMYILAVSCKVCTGLALHIKFREFFETHGSYFWWYLPVITISEKIICNSQVH